MKAKLAFISGSTYSIRLLCAVLGVARSWFQDWQAGDQARTAKDRAEADLIGQIRGIFQNSGERSPRVHAELRAQGVRIARKRVARLMRENGLPRRKKRPPITAGMATASPPTCSSAPSRRIARIRSGWQGPWATRSGKLRMSPRTRAGYTWRPSRTPRDCRLEHHLRSSLCENALMMAIQHRAPPSSTIPTAASNTPVSQDPRPSRHQGLHEPQG
jgi:putative transposase